MDRTSFFSTNTVILLGWIISIICFSLDDAVYDKALEKKSAKLKAKSKKWKIIGIGVILMLLPLIAEFEINMIARIALAYPFIWYVFYDATYNVYRKLDLFYYGRTSGWYTKYRDFVYGIYPLTMLMAFIFGVALFYMNGSIWH